ncbi:MAG: hypothetical protein BWY78_00667 [Alphaproteobacteria bacterium ADurb.Bin438]|nr:MAG: hypothetical protein BWY78_00667 [Alphaproteobacteria bacterium ADurb.Bin438]
MKQGNNKNRNRGHNRNNNNNRNRINNVPSKNQVLESTGPSGKIRGNLMQLIEKYLGAGKDAVSQDDLVLAECCYQYADHYTRLLNVANAYDNSKREEQQKQQKQYYETRNSESSSEEISDTNEEVIKEEIENNEQKTDNKEKKEQENQIQNIAFLNTEIETPVEEKNQIKKKKIQKPRKKIEKEDVITDASA